MSKRFGGMKICLVGPIPPPAGGMANQTAQLKRLLENDGAQVDLLPVNPPYRPAWVASIPVIRALFRLFPYFFSLFKGIKQADVVHLMANSGWSWHLFAAPAVWIAWLCSTPLVVNYRGGHAETFFQKSWRIVSPSINKATAIIVPSTYLQEVFAKRNVETIVAPNVLDNSKFYPAQGEKRKDVINIIVTRNLEAIYGIDIVIRSFEIILKRFPNAELAIAGTGPLKNELHQLCEQLGVDQKVTFVGRLELEQMAEFYRKADIMLNASRVDNSPNSVIEALASGTPVVSTNVGGIPKLVVEGKDAILVEMDDVQGMANAAIQVLSNDETKRSLIRSGLESVQRFAWQQVGQTLLDCYKGAIKGSPAQ